MFDHLAESCNVRVRAVHKSTGQIVHERIGHNVWTNTGREYSCLLKTYRPDGVTPYRRDVIAYMGMGSGSQPETINVDRVTDPIEFSPGTWLKPIAHARTVFRSVGAGVRTAVRYTCTYSETDFILNNSGSALISECGLFTDGAQDTFERGMRDTNINAGLAQAPVAYHSFDPIPKTSGIELEIVWELRH